MTNDKWLIFLGESLYVLINSLVITATKMLAANTRTIQMKYAYEKTTVNFNNNFVICL